MFCGNAGSELLKWDTVEKYLDAEFMASECVRSIANLNCSKRLLLIPSQLRTPPVDGHEIGRGIVLLQRGLHGEVGKIIRIS